MWRQIDGVTQARAVEGRTRSSAAARGEARAPVSRRRADAQGKTNRQRREEEERKGGGVRQGRRGGDRSAPGTGAYIPGRFTPGASHQPGVKGFFLAGHETAAHLYSRVGFPPGSKGGLQFRFPPVLSKFFNRNIDFLVKYIVN